MRCTLSRSLHGRACRLSLFTILPDDLRKIYRLPSRIMTGGPYDGHIQAIFRFRVIRIRDLILHIAKEIGSSIKRKPRDWWINSLIFSRAVNCTMDGSSHEQLAAGVRFRQSEGQVEGLVLHVGAPIGVLPVMSLKIAMGEILETA
jgi:hypothetical protein